MNIYQLPNVVYVTIGYMNILFCTSTIIHNKALHFIRDPLGALFLFKSYVHGRILALRGRDDFFFKIQVDLLLRSSKALCIAYL